MLFTRALFLSLLVSVMMQMVALGQICPTAVSTEIKVSLREQAPFEKSLRSLKALATVKESDSLLGRRTFFSTAIIEHGERLNQRSVLSVMEDVPQAQIKYIQGQILKPVGPLLIASGLVVGYVAIKGTKKTDYARGVGTPGNPSPPDVLVDYTSRSLPMLAGGIGLIVGGLCLIEIANGLTGRSIDLYNATVVPGQSVSGLLKVRLGITASGNIGIKANF